MNSMPPPQKQEYVLWNRVDKKLSYPFTMDDVRSGLVPKEFIENKNVEILKYDGKVKADDLK